MEYQPKLESLGSTFGSVFCPALDSPQDEAWCFLVERLESTSPLPATKSRLFLSTHLSQIENHSILPSVRNDL